METTTTQIPRPVRNIYQGVPTSDGEGVRLTRLIGTPHLSHLDPFLMLDEFQADSSTAQIGGFPDHPHRGFQTVTYMLAGTMRHRDNRGHESAIGPGAVQWMNAGRGIIHSEMPERMDGCMHGFQLWINLPADQKMQAPAYDEFTSEHIPTVTRDSGARIRAIAGQLDDGTQGPVTEATGNPLYLDVTLPNASAVLQQSLPPNHQAFVYPFEGEIAIGSTVVRAGEIAALEMNERIELKGTLQGGRALLLAAAPIGEPVARYGPFVMTTQAELRQAFDDYLSGRF